MAAPCITRNFTWALAGNLGYSATQWGVLILLARHLGPEAVGTFTLALAVSAPVFVLANLQLRTFQATDSRSEHDLEDYLGLRFTSSSLALLVSLALISTAMRSGAGVSAAIAICCSKAVESVSDILYGSFQQQQRMANVAGSLLLRGVFGLIAMTIALRSGLGLGIACWSVTAIWTAVLVGHDYPIARKILGRRLRPGFRWTRVRPVLIAAAPLAATTMLGSLNANIPRYFTEHYAGAKLLGILGGLAYLQAAVLGISIALSQVVCPRLARLRAAGDKAGFLRLLARAGGLASGLGIAGLTAASVAGGPILGRIYTPEFARYGNELWWLMLACVFLHPVALLNDALVAVRKVREQTAGMAVVSISVVTGSALLVPDGGVLGATQAVCAGAAAQFLVSIAILAVDAREQWAPANSSITLTGGAVCEQV